MQLLCFFFFFSNIFCGTLNKPFGIIFLRRKNHNLFSALLNYKNFATFSTLRRAAPAPPAPCSNHTLAHFSRGALFPRFLNCKKLQRPKLSLFSSSFSCELVFSFRLFVRPPPPRYRCGVFSRASCFYRAVYYTLAVEILYTEWKAAHTDKRAQTISETFYSAKSTFSECHSKYVRNRTQQDLQ